MHLHFLHQFVPNKKNNKNENDNESEKENKGTFPHSLLSQKCGKLCGKPDFLT